MVKVMIMGGARRAVILNMEKKSESPIEAMILVK